MSNCLNLCRAKYLVSCKELCNETDPKEMVKRLHNYMFDFVAYEITKKYYSDNNNNAHDDVVFDFVFNYDKIIEDFKLSIIPTIKDFEEVHAKSYIPRPDYMNKNISIHSYGVSGKNIVWKGSVNSDFEKWSDRVIIR